MSVEKNNCSGKLNKPSDDADGLFVSCEGEVRTPDLWVMSPTSYRCSTSRCKSKGIYVSSQTNSSKNIKKAFLKKKALKLIHFN